MLKIKLFKIILLAAVLIFMGNGGIDGVMNKYCTTLSAASFNNDITSPATSASFLAGTKVSTQKGNKNIEDIKIGGVA